MIQVRHNKCVMEIVDRLTDHHDPICLKELAFALYSIVYPKLDDDSPFIFDAVKNDLLVELFEAPMMKPSGTYAGLESDVAQPEQRSSKQRATKLKKKQQTECERIIANFDHKVASSTRDVKIGDELVRWVFGPLQGLQVSQIEKPVVKLCMRALVHYIVHHQVQFLGVT